MFEAQKKIVFVLFSFYGYVPVETVGGRGYLYFQKGDYYFLVSNDNSVLHDIKTHQAHNLKLGVAFL